MTLTPTRPAHPGLPARAQLPPLPGRTLTEPELRAWVRELAQRPELWEHLTHRESVTADQTVTTDQAVTTDQTGPGEGDGPGRHYVSLYRDADIDVWVLCWDLVDDTGWHDHDTSSGAVAVTRGAVSESQPCLGGTPTARTIAQGADFAFGPDHIHRMGGAVDGSVSLHAYSPPLWRMGQYSISEDGVMRRLSVSYADELRPI